MVEHPVSQNSRSAGAGRRPQIALALQGGRSHSAFTWGVLDRLLAPNARGRTQWHVIFADSLD